MIKQKTLKNDERAVSPVIAEILMVAIVVILAAVIGAYVFGISPTGVYTPNVQVLASISATDDKLKLEHRGGDALNLSDCTVRVDGSSTPVTGWSPTHTLTIGQSATSTTAVGSFSGGEAARVEIIYNPSSSYLLDTYITVGT